MEKAPQRGPETLRRSDYSGLWPFWSRETFEDGSVREAALFGAVRSERLPNGDRYDRVLPFYETSSAAGGSDKRLAIYPLLYLGRKSPEVSYDIVLPFFARWREDDSRHLFLLPLLHLADLERDEPFRFLPALFASGTWRHGSQQRLGLPYVFDLFERSDGADETAWTLGAFCPWGPPARFGLPLARYRRNKEEGAWDAHFAPLFFAGGGPPETGTGYLHTPFYGTWRNEAGERGRILPWLLSWWISGPERSDVQILWPLFRRLETPEARAFRVLPFYDRFEGAGERVLGIGGFLYRRHENVKEKRTAHWFLFPLVLHERSPTSAADWILPFYLDVEEESETTRRKTAAYGPFYIAHSFETRTREGGWRTAERWFHIWPFYGRQESRFEDRDERRETHFVLAPFFQFQRTYRLADGEPTGFSLDCPLPLLNYRSGPESRDFRLLPFVFTGEGHELFYACFFPLLSVRSGLEATEELFFLLHFFRWYDGRDERWFQVSPFLFEWYEAGDTERITGPLWWFRYRTSGDGGWFHLFPLAYSKWEEERSELGIFPLFYRREFGSSPIDRWLLERFFFLWNSMRSEHQSYDSFLWKVFEYTRASGGDYDFRILHRLFVDRRAGGQREFVLNPFFSSFADSRTGRRSVSVLGFVYRVDVEGGIETERLFFIPISRRKL